MKSNILPFLFVSFSLVLTFSFQSCSESGSSDSNILDGSIKEMVKDKISGTKSKDKKHSEMSSQEKSDFVAKHAEHLHFVENKMIEIKNETIKKKDQFQFECEKGTASIERQYNDKNEIHLLTFTHYNSDSTAISTKHHFFWENKLIYQFYHHEVEEGSKYVVDDHKTFFKDGVILKALEKKYSYNKNEPVPHDAVYELVDLDSDSKLTKDMEKLLASSEGDIKTYLCK